MNVELVGYAIDSSGADPRPPLAVVVPAGETGRVGVTVKHRDGTAVNLTGAQLLFTAARYGVVKLSRQATIDNVLLGTAHFPLVVADTVDVVGAPLDADVWLTTVDGSRYTLFKPGALTVVPAEGRPDQPITVPPTQQPLAVGPMGDSNAFSAESFRTTGASDADTAELAMAQGVPISFPKRTYTFNRMVVNTACYRMIGQDTTFKLADGIIANTDADPYHHTAILRVQGVQGFSMVGKWTIDGNRDAQTYPATVNTFGRGAAINAGGSRSNGVIEFTPDLLNQTPCRDIRLEGLLVQNAYTNGLVFWQCEGVRVRNCHTKNNRVNGIAGAGCTDVYITHSRFYRDGWSDIIDTSRRMGDGAGVQFRELPADLSAATLSMPSIPVPVANNAQVNRNIQIIDCSGEDCGVESFFLRACFPGVMRNLVSRNCGYKRLDIPGMYHAAHFWGDAGWWIWDNLVAYQTRDNATSGWQRPDVAVFAAFDGNGTNNTIDTGFKWAIDGSFNSIARNVRGVCGLSAAQAKQTNFNRGFLVWEHSLIEDVELEGLSAEAAVVINGALFNSRPPNNVTLRNWRVSNADCTRVIWPQKFGTTSGAADNLTVDGLYTTDIRSPFSGTGDHHIIEIDATLAAVDQHNLKLVNLDIDCLNTTSGAAGGAQGSFCGVKLRNPQTTKNIKVDFKRCLNAFSPLLATGFADLDLTGYIDTARRLMLIDHATNTANSGRLAVKVRTTNINSELFFLQNFTTWKINLVRVTDCDFNGINLCRTFPASTGGITVTADSYFAEAVRFIWKDNRDDYGSNTPGTFIYDMRRRFSGATTLGQATPFYLGEVVWRTDDSSVWIGVDSRTAGAWKQLP